MPEENYGTDYWFGEFTKDAVYWNKRESEQDAWDIFKLDITIPSALGAHSAGTSIRHYLLGGESANGEGTFSME